MIYGNFNAVYLNLMFSCKIWVFLQFFCLKIKDIYYMAGAKGDWEFRISDQVKNPDGTDIYPSDEFR